MCGCAHAGMPCAGVCMYWQELMIGSSLEICFQMVGRYETPSLHTAVEMEARIVTGLGSPGSQ